jgi:hypothetical protein
MSGAFNSSSLSDLAAARREHSPPVRLQKLRLPQRIARVLAPGFREIEARVDEHFVAIVRQRQHP